MSSKDVLEGLFDVEHEAVEIVEAARAEARRRAETAKSASRALVEEARARALAEAKDREASAANEIDRTYSDAIESFKSSLAAAENDREAFASACRASLDKLFPR
jgi:F0F1-type ATP synthase membrane subunit b/b'